MTIVQIHVWGLINISIAKEQGMRMKQKSSLSVMLGAKNQDSLFILPDIKRKI